MTTLSGIITPSNVETASSASTLTNKTINGSNNTITNVSLSTGVTGTLPVANGGTGVAALTANNVVLGNGTSAVQFVAPGTAGNLLTSNGTTWQSTAPAPGAGTYQATASGALTNGGPVLVNADGTVSAVTGQEESQNQTSSGVPASFIASTAFDSGTNTMVFLYKDLSTNYPTVVAATYNTSTKLLTFGTPVVLRSQNIYTVLQNSGVIRVASNTFVAGYFQYASQGYLRPFTVSGTTITLGTEDTNLTSVLSFSLVWHPTTSRVIAFYSLSASTTLYYRVWSISGTTLTTTHQGNTPITNGYFANGNFIASVYSASTDRILVFYARSTDYAMLGAVLNWNGSSMSGNAGYGISGGNPVEQTGLSSRACNIVLDDVNQRYFIGQSRNGSTASPANAYQFRWGTFTNSTISAVTGGTSISGGNDSQEVYVAWSVTANKLLINNSGAYKYGTISGSTLTLSNANLQYLQYAPQYAEVNGTIFGSGSGWQVNMTFGYSTATTGNFIGFADNNYSNGQTATIQTIGSVDDAQTSLTPGQSYYLQSAGTIGLTPSTVIGTVFVGTAVAPTKIIVKG